MKNRYGDVYSFVKESEDTFRITGDLKHWRFAGREGQQQMDFNDLGFVDPSGGPFIELGMQLDGRKIVRIRAGGDLDGSPVVLFDVEPEQ